MAYWRECEYCGARLDPGEKCDCLVPERCPGGAKPRSPKDSLKKETATELGEVTISTNEKFNNIYSIPKKKKKVKRA